MPNVACETLEKNIFLGCLCDSFPVALMTRQLLNVASETLEKNNSSSSSSSSRSSSSSSSNSSSSSTRGNIFFPGAIPRGQPGSADITCVCVFILIVYLLYVFMYGSKTGSLPVADLW